MMKETGQIIEDQVARLLLHVYPTAYLAPVQKTIGTSRGSVLPDLVFGLPQSRKRVFLELTGGCFPGNERKRKQRNILLEYAQTHPDIETLVLYLQNLAILSSIIPSLEVLDELARGSLDTLHAQVTVDQIARSSKVPYWANNHDVKWLAVYDQAIARIPPRK